MSNLFGRSALVLALVLAPVSQVYAQLVTRVIDGDTLVVQEGEAQPEECVDINRADSDELQQIIHIGPVRARQILELRRERPFRSVNELTRVNGIAAARLRDIIAQGVACVTVALG